MSTQLLTAEFPACSRGTHHHLSCQQLNTYKATEKSTRRRWRVAERKNGICVAETGREPRKCVRMEEPPLGDREERTPGRAAWVRTEGGPTRSDDRMSSRQLQGDRRQHETRCSPSYTLLSARILIFPGWTPTPVCMCTFYSN